MIGNILVLCEGNVCRSPMAAAVLRAALPGRSVTSAGFNALIGVPAMPFAQEVMRARGLSIDDHRGRQLGHAACVEAELILVMDRHQRALLESQYPFARGKIFRIGEYKNFDVHDPYRQPRFVFERCARLIETGVADWQARLRLI